jgi:hypothetical protein
MSLSAYDRWKTTPPPYQLQVGDCLECGGADQWITGRTLIGRKASTIPKAIRRAVLAALKTNIEAGGVYCGSCGSNAIHARFAPCHCGADRAWSCVCP